MAHLAGHAVLVFGYGVDEHSHLPYVLMHNSWGRSWGNNGEVRIAYSAFNYFYGCTPNATVVEAP